MTIPEAVRDMLAIVEKLCAVYPKKRFTLDGRLVGEQAVRALAVLAQALAVVAGEDDQRPRRGRLQERNEQGPQRGVGGGDLTYVGGTAIAGRVRLRGHVGGVRLVDMDPAEGGAAVALGEPAARRGHRLLAAPLGQGQGSIRSGEPVVVDVEPAAEAEARVQGEGADERARPVSSRLEEGGEGRPVAREAEAGVVAHAVLEGQPAGQDVGVRGQGDDVVGVGLPEDHARGGQAVQVGSRARGRAVGAQRVGAEGVDGDEEDVEPGLPRDLVRGATGVQGGGHDQRSGTQGHRGQERTAMEGTRRGRRLRRVAGRGGGAGTTSGTTHGRMQGPGHAPRAHRASA